MTLFPPPETTPLLTDSDDTGTPSCCEANPSNVCRAHAAAARVPFPADPHDRVARVLTASVRCHVRVVGNKQDLVHIHVELFGGDHLQAGV